MQLNRGNRASIGRIIEEAAATKYHLEREGKHEKWRDGIDLQGRSVEIKSAVKLRSAKPNGERYPGYYEIQSGGHNRLMRESQSSYVFGVFDSDKNRIEELRRYPSSVVDDFIRSQHTADSDLINIRWDKLYAYSSQYS